jgi:hypothetical protein
MAVAKLLDYTAMLLYITMTGYRLEGRNSVTIGTWHFSYLIFDLVAHLLMFSRALVQDLLK